ncbi:hypothetical protein [Leekyejoonella antrihumi]|nr:hypothetical protein [Leekyejoonella antrihumi]
MKNQITTRVTGAASAVTTRLLWTTAVAVTLLTALHGRAATVAVRKTRERGFTAIETALIVAGGLVIATLLVVVATKAYNTHAAGIK